jgi:hypothetical protein
MPRLGQPVEPAHADRVEPWWRGVDQAALPQPRADEPAEPDRLPKAMPWPID